MAIVNYANTDFGVVVESEQHLKALCRNDENANFSSRDIIKAANELGVKDFANYALKKRDYAVIDEMLDNASLDFLLEVLKLPDNPCIEKAREKLEPYRKELVDMLEEGDEKGAWGLANLPYGLSGRSVDNDTARVLGERALILEQYDTMHELYNSLWGEEQKNFVDKLYNRGKLQQIHFNYASPLFRNLKHKDNAFLGRHLKAGIDSRLKFQIAKAIDWPDVLYSAAQHFFSHPMVDIGIEYENPQFFFKPSRTFGKICDNLGVEKLHSLYNFIEERYNMYQRKMLAYEAKETITKKMGRKD